MNIKLLVMDVDGTLTNGAIYMGNNGEIMKAFNVRDGYGIVMLKQRGIIPAIITGRKSEIVSRRAKELGITELYQGSADKLVTLKKLLKDKGISPLQAAFIGDDLNDIDCIKYCGISGCPSDAVAEIQRTVTYNCKARGGRGAVREFIDFILKQ